MTASDFTDLTQAMDEYASAMRGDWSDFDGRAERYVTQDWIAEIRSPTGITIHSWRERLGLCPNGGGHWTAHCAMFRCPTTTGESA